MSNKGRIIETEFALPEFEYLKGNEWIWTEKVNGTNIRVDWIRGDSRILGSKTDNAQIPQFLFQRLQERFLTEETKDNFKEKFEGSDNVCLYGEGYGANIQKGGGNYRQDQDFVLFDVKIGDWWLQRKDVEDIALYLGLDIVPIIGVGTLADCVALTRGGFNSAWGNFTAEGIVARPKTELIARNGHRIITKIKHKDFVPTAGRKQDLYQMNWIISFWVFYIGFGLSIIIKTWSNKPSMLSIPNWFFSILTGIFWLPFLIIIIIIEIIYRIKAHCSSGQDTRPSILWEEFDSLMGYQIMKNTDYMINLLLTLKEMDEILEKSSKEEKGEQL